MSHWLKKEGMDQEAYIRLGSINQKSDSDLIQKLRRSVMGLAFYDKSSPTEM